MYVRSKLWILYQPKRDLKHYLLEKWALYRTDKLKKHKTCSVDVTKLPEQHEIEEISLAVVPFYLDFVLEAEFHLTQITEVD